MNTLLKYLLIIFFVSYTVQSYSQIDFLYDKVSEQPTEIPPYSEFLEFEPLDTRTSYYNPIDINEYLPTYYCKSTVMLYQSSSSNSAIIREIPFGEKVKVQFSFDDVWWEIKYKGASGYVRKADLSHEKPKEQSIEELIKEASLVGEAAVLKDRLENGFIPTEMTTFADVNKYDDLNIPDIIGVDQEPLYNQVKSNTSITTSSYSNQDEETYRSGFYSGNNTTGETPYGRYFFIGFLILVVFTLGAVFGKRV